MQRQKEEVRTEIEGAARALFAEVGYGATSIAGVAARAGFSTGNVYRYFESKEDLFAAAVPPGFGDELARRTRARIEALGSVRDTRLLAADARYHVLADELLDFTILHREAVVILLLRGAGTPYAGFARSFRGQLVELALGYVGVAWPSLLVTPALRFALDRIYDGFLESVATALATGDDADRIRTLVHQFTVYHQGGLKRLFEELADGGEHPRSSSPVSATPSAGGRP